LITLFDNNLNLTALKSIVGGRARAF